MSVYYISAPEVGLVKIGHTKNIRRRLPMLQTGSPVQLTLLAVEVGGEELESERHTTFADLRRRGEWFEHSGALADFIASLEPLPVKPVKFGPKELGEATGWGRSYCSMLLSDSRKISFRTALHIYLSTGRKYGPLVDASEADMAIIAAIPLRKAA